jgi:hypothetical protein
MRSLFAALWLCLCLLFESVLSQSGETGCRQPISPLDLTADLVRTKCSDFPGAYLPQYHSAVSCEKTDEEELGYVSKSNNNNALTICNLNDFLPFIFNIFFFFWWAVLLILSAFCLSRRWRTEDTNVGAGVSFR